MVSFIIWNGTHQNMEQLLFFFSDKSIHILKIHVLILYIYHLYLIQCTLCNVLIIGRVLTKWTSFFPEFRILLCCLFNLFFLLSEQLHLYIQIYGPHLFAKEWFWAVPKDCQLLLFMSPYPAGNIQNSHFYFRNNFCHLFWSPNFTSSSQKAILIKHVFHT